MEHIQDMFGHHDVSGVTAYRGAEAADAAQSLGARAYAAGDSVVLGEGADDLHTVAHEAAHVIQQRGGVSLKDGVGQAGDVYEQHADAVADAVVAGRSAEPLLDSMSGSTPAGPSTHGKHAQMVAGRHAGALPDMHASRGSSASTGADQAVQCKLLVGGKKKTRESALAGVRRHRLKLGKPPAGKTGVKMLTKMVHNDEHEFDSFADLYLELLVADGMRGAAMEANRKIGFSAADHKTAGDFDVSPKSIHWELRCQKKAADGSCEKKNEIGNLVCKTAHYSAALDELFDQDILKCDCSNHVQISLLRALQKAVGSPNAFNARLTSRLKGRPLTVPLPFDLQHLLPHEQTILPGMRVNFVAESIPEAQGTIWRNESAVCVGWNAKGEELYVGGGLQRSGQGSTADEVRRLICAEIHVRPTKSNLKKILLNAVGAYVSVLRSP